MEAEPLSEVIQSVGPSILREAATTAGLGGVLGLAVGGIVGTIRGTTPLLFALGSGVQIGTLGFMYTGTQRTATVWVARHDEVAADDLSTTDKRSISIGAGATSAVSAAILFRGRSNILPGLLVGSIAGYCLPIRESKAAQLNKPLPKDYMGVMEWIANSRLNPMQKLTDDEYKHMLREKQIRAEADIALLDEQIARLKAESKQGTEQSKS